MSAIGEMAHQMSNSYITVESRVRLPGVNINSFQTPTNPTAQNILSVVPVAVDTSALFIENCNERNNVFIVNGTTITIPQAHYPVSTIAALFQNTFAAVFGFGVILVNNLSQFPDSIRLQFVSAAPISVSGVNPYFNRWTGITNTTAPALSHTFEYSLGLPTLYFDITGEQIHRGIADDLAGRTAGGVMFRIPLTRNAGFVENQQSSEKIIYYPERTAWPRTVWELVDEWGLPLLCAPGSAYWFLMTSIYHQPQNI